MEQKWSNRKPSIRSAPKHLTVFSAKTVKQLLYTLYSDSEPLSGCIQEQLMGSDGLRLLAAAMTILLTDYDGTTPSGTCEAIAKAGPQPLPRLWC